MHRERIEKQKPVAANEDRAWGSHGDDSKAGPKLRPKHKQLYLQQWPWDKLTNSDEDADRDASRDGVIIGEGVHTIKRWSLEGMMAEYSGATADREWNRSLAVDHQKMGLALARTAEHAVPAGRRYRKRANSLEVAAVAAIQRWDEQNKKRAAAAAAAGC